MYHMGFFALGAAFILLFVGQTINKLPRDILILKEFYEERNWTEFWVHFFVCGVFWLGSAIIIFNLFIPLLGLQIKGWANVFNLYRFLGR